MDDVAITTGEDPPCQPQKVTLSHRYGNISQVNKQPAGDSLITFDTSVTEGEQFVLFGIDTHAGDGFAFTVNNNPAKMPFEILEIALFTVREFSMVLLLNKEMHSEQTKGHS